MSPDSLDPGVVIGASVASVRARVGAEASPDRLSTEADCVQDRSKDIGKLGIIARSEVEEDRSIPELFVSVSRKPL